MEGRVNTISPGSYEAAQAARVPVKSSEDDENFVFDIQPNRVDTVKFVAAQTMSRPGTRTLEKFSRMGTRSSIHFPRDLSHLSCEKREDMIMRETSTKRK